MQILSNKKIASSLFSIFLLISSCSQIQDPQPEPTRDILSNAPTTPPSPQATDPSALEAPAVVITSTQTAAATVEVSDTLPATCSPTQADALGPFYKPGAPVRDKVGEGYILSGLVRSSEGCTPIPGAQIEVWMAGPDGNYTDDYRATLFSDENGAYRFESHVPPPYSGRPPHIHLQVSADGYQTLVTQHYPAQSQTEATFDIILVPN